MRGRGPGDGALGADRWRNWALTVLSVPAVLLVLEVALIPFPVTDVMRYAPADSDHSVFRRQPGQQFFISHGWNFKFVNRVRINNYGFVSDLDYDAGATTPLAAVIGDSFVEALELPWRETCAGRLADHASPRLRVYSFGMSGAPLSQYLAYAQYVRDKFRPSAMVFVIVGNDFHESMISRSWELPFAYFEDGDAGSSGLVANAEAPGLVTIPFHESSWWVGVAKRSNLVRYFAKNLNLKVVWVLWARGSVRASPPPIQEVASSSVTLQDLGRPARERPDVLADSKQATDRFFELLPQMSGLAPSQIAFVVDGPRFALYDEEGLEGVQDSHRVVNRRYFMATAEGGGYEVLDMLPVFADHWQANGARFDWPDNEHWNALGNRLCFESLANSSLMGALMEAGALMETGK